MNRFVTTLAIFVVGVALVTPTTALAQDTARFPIPDLQIRIPGMANVLTDAVSTDCPEGYESDETEGCLAFPWIGQYISSLYIFGVYAATILSAIVIMVAGFLWLTSGGNTNQIGSARSYISGALLGLMLMLGSYTVLRLVNPNLVQFTALRIPVLKRVTLQEFATNLYQAGGKVSVCVGANGQIISDASLSPEILTAINEFGNDPEINPAFIAAIIKTESNFRPGVEGPWTKYGYAFGLMQVLPTTAEGLWKDTGTRPAACERIYEGRPPRYTASCKAALTANPREQVRIGATYLKQIRDQLARCGQAGKLNLVAAGYNAGPNRDSLCKGSVPPFAQTVDYVKKVNASLENYCTAAGGTVVSQQPDFAGPPEPPEQLGLPAGTQ